MSKSQNIAETVYTQLREQILSGRSRPDTRLTISDLCASFGVNLGAVREALSRLAGEGLVEVLPKRGFQVAGISHSDLKELTIARSEVEASCLKLAIARGGVRWENEICHSLDALADASYRDPNTGELTSEWSCLHGAFHLALVSACDNRWLLKMRGILYEHSERYRRLSVPATSETRDVQSEHRAIAEAVLARDSDIAVELITRHFRRTTDILLSAKPEREEV